jgi:hypothetical protein
MDSFIIIHWSNFWPVPFSEIGQNDMNNRKQGRKENQRMKFSEHGLRCNCRHATEVSRQPSAQR